jgi:hypothetical protein
MLREYYSVSAKARIYGRFKGFSTVIFTINDFAFTRRLLKEIPAQDASTVYTEKRGFPSLLEKLHVLTFE